MVTCRSLLLRSFLALTLSSTLVAAANVKKPSSSTSSSTRHTSVSSSTSHTSSHSSTHTSSSTHSSTHTSSSISHSSTHTSSSTSHSISSSISHSSISPSTSPTSLLSSSSVLAAASSTVTLSATILVFSTDQDSSYSATSGLNAHGIPYQLVIVPSAGTGLPILNSSATNGNYGGIILLTEPSGLTTTQWQELYTYQEAFGVRMVRLDADPDGGADGSSFGTTGANSDSGCCNENVEQLVYFTDTSAFPTANLIENQGRSTIDLWHSPALITDPATTVEIAQFGPSSDSTFTTVTTAAVINTFGGRQQLVWFTSFGTAWSLTSNFIMHAHINWVTRGLYVGQRRVLFNSQVDDMHLETELYTPDTAWFRARPSDLDAHVAWQADLNSRLPAGSLYRIEIGHNGNGNVEYGVLNDTTGTICTPENWIQYTGDMTVPPLEFQKTLGTGTSIWPTSPGWLEWSAQCLALDELLEWFLVPTNRDQFSHVSHSFTHENEDNATYSDVVNEIQYNQAWLDRVSISSAEYYSPQGLIPPGITGLHNGDALQAWWDNGITYAVGDTSRPLLLNSDNEYWPLITNVAANGFAGTTVVPRWALPIYYNCDTSACNVVQWDDTAGGDGSFTDLLSFCRETWTSALLSLHQDPYMFHQANLRQGDTDSFTVGPVSGNLSLLQIFAETVLQELTRLTTWPVITKKHDDTAVAFNNRMAQDQCLPQLAYIVSGNAITNVSIVAQQGWCNVPIPVTFPTSATAPGATAEQLGSDPLTLWTPVGSSTVTFSLSEPIPL